VPDDGDAYARVNALNDMCSATGLLGDLRSALIISNRSIGELRGRDVEIALGRLEARDDESPPGKSQIEDMLRDAVADEPALARLAPQSLGTLEQLGELMRDRVGYDSAPDLQPLIDAVSGIGGLMPSAHGDGSADRGDSLSGDSSDEGAPMRSSGRGLGDQIDSREDALRAIDMVCEFLERTEPTNPAQMLLRRARRLVNKNFLELVRELAPEALAEVARIMGVPPDELGSAPSDD
jgi:type VI secretion system protein ImpA